MATALQQMLRDLQLNPEFAEDLALQQIVQRVQTELYANGNRPQPHVAPPIVLTPQQQQTFEAMQVFLALLCDYAGYVNRGEWLHLLDVAADLISGTASMVPGPQGPAGTPGKGLIVLGQFDTAAQLLAAHPMGPPQEGGAYLVGTTEPKHLFLYFDNAWHDVGPLTGVGIPEAPGTGADFVRNGLTQSWIEISHNGGTW